MIDADNRHVDRRHRAFFVRAVATIGIATVAPLQVVLGGEHEVAVLDVEIASANEAVRAACGLRLVIRIRHPQMIARPDEPCRPERIRARWWRHVRPTRFVIGIRGR